MTGACVLARRTSGPIPGLPLPWILWLTVGRESKRGNKIKKILFPEPRLQPHSCIWRVYEEGGTRNVKKSRDDQGRDVPAE